MPWEDAIPASSWPPPAHRNQPRLRILAWATSFWRVPIVSHLSPGMLHCGTLNVLFFVREIRMANFTVRIADVKIKEATESPNRELLFLSELVKHHFGVLLVITSVRGSGKGCGAMDGRAVKWEITGPKLLLQRRKQGRELKHERKRTWSTF